MTETHATDAKHGASPAKLILICVLAVTLMAVIYWNYFRESAPPNAVAEAATDSESTSGTRRGRGRTPPPAAEADVAASSQPGEQPKSPRKAWREFNLDEVVAWDPFALPGQFPQPHKNKAVAEPGADAAHAAATAAQTANADRAAVLAELQQDGVRVVLRTGQEFVAKIGGKEIRVGDKIGGFRVLDISFEGVVLEGDDSP